MVHIVNQSDLKWCIHLSRSLFSYSSWKIRKIVFFFIFNKASHSGMILITDIILLRYNLRLSKLKSEFISRLFCLQRLVFYACWKRVRTVCKTKRRRSDPVLWQKPLHQQKCQKGKVTKQTTPQKSSIKQKLRTDWGRSVGVTTATQPVWLTLFTGPLPTPRNSRVTKRTQKYKCINLYI